MNVNPNPEPVPDKLGIDSIMATPLAVWFWVTGAPCFVMEFASSPAGPWIQSGGVHHPDQPVEIPVNEFVGRYWRARAVPCEETEQPE